jgi:hypothetical protein
MNTFQLSVTVNIDIKLWHFISCFTDTFEAITSYKKVYVNDIKYICYEDLNP